MCLKKSVSLYAAEKKLRKNSISTGKIILDTSVRITTKIKDKNHLWVAVGDTVIGFIITNDSRFDLLFEAISKDIRANFGQNGVKF